MPWALLPNAFAQWQEHNDNSAWLEIKHEGLNGRYLVTFGDDGGIQRMETDRLLMEGNGVMQREVGDKLNYREVNGLRVPGTMDYRWYREDDTLWSHYRFTISDVVISD